MSMQPTRLLLVALLLAAPASAQTEAEWLEARFRSHDRGLAGPPPAGAPGPTAFALACWDWLRRRPPAPNLPLPLAETAQCLEAADGFPGLVEARRRAEAQAADPARTNDLAARAWFASVQPETAAGRARFALLLATDPARMTIARQQAKAAWTAPGLPEPLEALLLQRFGADFTREDHAARADALLWAGQTTAAGRLLPLLSDEERALSAARIALRTGAPDAEARAASVPARLRTHAGLVHDRSVWLERNRRLSDAEALLATAPVDPASLSAPRTWLQRRLTLARAAWRRGDARLAERILANHQSFAAGTSLSALPLGVRVDLSDTEWLAGFLALRKTGRPEAASQHFTRFLATVTTPVSRSRGEYWLGRAEAARGNASASRAAFERGAQYFDVFYGQLAAEALGRLPILPEVAPVAVAPGLRAEFEARPLVKAALLLKSMGQEERLSPILRAIATAATTPEERRAAADLGARMARSDLAVWAWREGRASGDMSLLGEAWPRLPPGAPIAPERLLYSHAIARQESSFDRFAVSVAGARGLMQLMPGTAADVARRLGLPHATDRLFEPFYNVQLGSSYLGARRDQFGSWMLAAVAYNAGAGRARQWVEQFGDPRLPTSAGGVDPIDWIETIPISETRTYVQRVTENAVVYSLMQPDWDGANPRASVWIR
jgi:soluble lytic murein transglycosylase